MRLHSPGLLLLLACGGKGDGEAEEAHASGDSTIPTDSGAEGDWLSIEEDVLIATCGVLRLHVSLFGDGTAHLRYQGPDDEAEGRSWAVLGPPSPVPATLTELEEGVRLEDGALVVDIDRDCRIRILDTLGNPILEDGPTGGWWQEPGADPALGIRRESPVGQHIFGLGNRTGPMDHRGQILEQWNTDAYDGSLGGFAPDADPLYLCIPLYITLQDGLAAGVLTDSPGRLIFDLAASDGDLLQIEASQGVIDQWVFAGPSLALVLDRATALTGRPALPPLWALGFHQSRWGYWPDSALTELAAGFRSRGIPADALWLDIQHMDGYRSFTWDPTGFPDPPGLITGLGDEGFRVVNIADPGIKVDPGWSVYDSLIAEELALRWPDGTVYTGKAWPGDSVWPDTSDPDARAWWADNIAGLAHQGVAGIWLDVNEPTTFPEGGGGTTIDEAVLADGDGLPTTMAELHGVYALLQAQATYEGLLAARPEERPFILTRAGYAGSQRYAAAWTGDAPSTWEALDATLPTLLGLGLSAMPFVGSDVGGYSGGTSAELYARWMQLGAVSPFFRAHVTQGAEGHEPWAFGEEVEAISKARIEDRYALLPFWMSLFYEAHETGAPPLRPLAWRWPGDETAVSIDDEALIGDALLIAPVTTEGASSRAVYLPAGRWFEHPSGAVIEGPTWIEVELRLAALPTYVAEGAILILGPGGQSTDALGTSPIRLDLYPGETASTFTWFEEDGLSTGWESGVYRALPLSLQRDEAGATLIAGPVEGSSEPPERTLLARIRRVDFAPSGVSLDGLPLDEFPDRDSLLAAGEGWWWDENDLSLQVAFPDPGAFTLRADYDPTLSELAPAVKVDFVVRLPEGTPAEETIYMTTDALDWVMSPLVRVDADTAEGSLVLPRGEWFDYKFTRGDWCTVEKWPDCEEADNRYGFAVAGTREDTVYGWRDWCEGC